MRDLLDKAALAHAAQTSVAAVVSLL